MPRARFSIFGLMCLVALIAVDIALVPALLRHVSNAILFGVAGSIVMANLLALSVGLLAVGRRRPGPFLTGFLVGATAALLAYVVAIAFFRSAVIPLLLRYTAPLEDWADANLGQFVESARAPGSVARLVLWLAVIAAWPSPARSSNSRSQRALPPPRCDGGARGLTRWAELVEVDAVRARRVDTGVLT